MREHSKKLVKFSATWPASPHPKAAREDARASPELLWRSSSLRIVAPELFTELVHRYGTLLDEAVDQRVHQGGSISTELSDLSALLGQLQAGARDVIELHASALGDKLASAPPPLTKAYVEEGRFVVLELMGRLLSDYRTAFLQATQLSGQASSGLASAGAYRGNEE